MQESEEFTFDFWFEAMLETWEIDFFCRVFPAILKASECRSFFLVTLIGCKIL